MSTPAADLSALRIRRDDLDPNRPRPWRRRIIWLCVLAVIAAGGWLAWRADLLPRSAPAVSVARPRVMQAGGVEEVLTATGYLVPQVRATVSARTTGRLDWLGVTEGSRVRQGDVIARLSSDDAAAEVAESRASLAQRKAELEQARATQFLSERELQRQERLSADGITSQADHDGARRSHDVAIASTRAAEESVRASEARLNLSEANFDKTIIRAPISGIVIRKNAYVGEMVAAGAFSGQPTGGAIVTIADFSSLEMEADINEANLSRIKEGQHALVTADAVPDHRYRGVVRHIVPTADRQKAVVVAKVKILEPDDRLVPDMSAKVSFLSEEVDAQEASAPPRLFIPSGAIHTEGSDTFVLAVREDRVVRLPVQLGEVRGGLREATAGITSQDMLIVGGQEGLRAGDRVRIAS